ncbi:hypothetical protein F5Y18DRAFT_411817 [Xylariaceae sp. FL1019]|nr:hypothetical protein F5Y18DRAFT_411817 [Xylariaceae sp. FL1019]
MAEITRISRPWLLPSRHTIPLRASAAALPLLYRGFSSTTPQAKKPYKKQISRAAQSMEKTRAEMLRMRNNMMQNSSRLLMMTMVPPPIRRWSRSPGEFFRMSKLVGTMRMRQILSHLGLKFMSMPTFFSWPVLKFNKGACVPTVKAMHVMMNEAVASGDVGTLRNICAMEWYEVLAGGIQTRPKNTTMEWELVNYHHEPRLASFMVNFQPPTYPGEPMMLIKQAIVCIESTQRLSKVVNGVKEPAKPKTIREFIVVQAEIDQKTYESGPWKIWGLVNEQSYRQLVAEKEMWDSAQQLT